MNRFSICIYSFLLTLLTLCLLTRIAHATHIRAGEITARCIDPQSITYEITLTGYADRDSQVIFGSNGTLDFGDGTSLIINNDGNTQPGDPNFIQRELLTPVTADTWIYTFKVRHTFPSARTYVVSFREFYRNENVLNMDNSVNMPFYIETALFISPIIENSHTPVFSRPAIDKAFVGKTYHHQPGAFDNDGDSISYHLTISQQDRLIPVAGFRLPDRTFPEDDTRNGSGESGAVPSICINPFTGDISWDTPGTRGEYNISFYVREWRKINGTFEPLGYVVRDMQIIVENAEDTWYPQLSFPFNEEKIAPAPGEPCEWVITTYAPTTADSIILEVWGDFLERTGANVSARIIRAKGEASIVVRWTGEENNKQHYQLIARSYYPSNPHITRNRSIHFYQNSSTVQAQLPPAPGEQEGPDSGEEPDLGENPVPDDDEITPPLGVQPTVSLRLQVFPNPAKNGKVYVSLPEATGRLISYQVYNLRGQLSQQNVNIRMQEKHPLILPNAKEGAYLLLIHYNSKIYKSKIVVE